MTLHVGDRIRINGYALAAGKRVMLVGPRENVFHCLPSVEHHATLQSVRHALAETGSAPGIAEKSQP